MLHALMHFALAIQVWFSWLLLLFLIATSLPLLAIWLQKMRCRAGEFLRTVHSP